MKKTRLLYLIALASTALFITLQWFDPDVIGEKIESKTYDVRLIVRSHFKTQTASNDIVIVAIDDKSIKETLSGIWSMGLR